MTDGMRDDPEVRPPRDSRSGLLWQVALVCLTWGVLVWLLRDNDGLWSPDAPQHAANGLFFKDFLLDPSLDAKGYALSYYARYPVIKPTSYPPLFYFLEAVSYGVFGSSPHVAKTLVLLFALGAALYTTVWLRRWIGVCSGWAGVLLLLLPGVVTWSNVVMLNVPAAALVLATLFHAHCWLDSPRDAPAWRHGYLAAAFGLLAVLTYYLSGVVLPIILIWMLARRRWVWLARRRLMVPLLLAALLFVPCAVMVILWAPEHLAWLAIDLDTLRTPATWTYYACCMTRLFTPQVLGLAATGAVCGLVSRRWRRETSLLLIWVAVTYVLFSCYSSRSPRYILPVAPALVLLCGIGVSGLAQRVRSIPAFGGRRTGTARGSAEAWLTAVLSLAFGLFQAWWVSRSEIPAVRGVREVVAWAEANAPDEPVFYNGGHFDIFTFYLRIGDPEFRRQVVRGDKLLYAYAVHRRWRLVEFVHSPEEVVEVLRTRAGCRWLFIARRDHPPEVAAERHLHRAIEGPEFERIRSFPVESRFIERIDLYRFKIPIEHPDEIDLPFPILGEGVRFRVRPIRH